MRHETPWEAHEALLEKNHRTTFEETSAIEIDERLAAEDPEHEESIEFRRINRERCSEAAEGLLRLLEILIPEGGRISPMTPASIGSQVLVLLWLLQSSAGDIREMSMAAIAEKIGCTRALLSFYAKRFERVLGFHGRGMKGKEASESYVESARRGWETRRKRRSKTAATSEPEPIPVGIEEIQRMADRAPRRFELEDEQEIDADADGFSFDHRRREYEIEEE